MGSKWTAREYEKHDESMVAAWWKAHRDGRFPAEILPPVGVIVELDGVAQAALWLYMAVGVGVCWLEYPISRPGISIRTTREAFDCALGAITEVARTHDYHAMIANTLPAIARHLTKSHAFTCRGELTHLEKLI